MSKRSIIVGVRLNSDEYMELMRLAEELDRTVPDTLRWLARQEFKARGWDVGERHSDRVLSRITKVS